MLTGPASGWVALHTEFGPSPSTHLNRFAGDELTSAWDTFAPAHLDYLALVGGHVFFPDGCADGCAPGQRPGVEVFDALTGGPAPVVEVGFTPSLIAGERPDVSLAD